MKTFTLHKVEDWERVVDALMSHLKPGMIIALSGPLGVGKTTFVQHLARRLGVKRPIPSPTFTLIRTYPLPSTLYSLRRFMHVDAYRIERPEDVQSLNLDEELNESGTLLIIEWPEHIRAWTKKKKMTTLRIRMLGAESRTVTIA